MIQNLTPFAAKVLPCFSTEGHAQSVIVVKATYDFAGQLVAQGQALPVYHGDEYFKIEGLTDVIRFESDIAPLKPNIDVIINAVAYAPGGKPREQFQAGVCMDDHERLIMVSGKRVWRRRLGLIPTMSQPEPAHCVPVVYSLAYGGADKDKPDQFWPNNPTGSGFSANMPQDGLLLPQIEWLDDLIQGPAHPSSPAGFGCFGRAWQPRQRLLGQYSSQELAFKGLATKMPRSFQPEAWNCAHPRMQFPTGSIRAGTHFELINLSAKGQLEFKLPATSVAIAVEALGAQVTAYPAFDTVAIEPELGHVALIWRHVVHGVPIEQLGAVKVYFK